MREGGRQDWKRPSSSPREKQRPPAEVLRERARKGEWDPDIWYQQMMDSGMVATEEDALISRRKFLLGAGAVAATLVIDNVGKFTPLAKWLDDKVVGQYDYDAEVSRAKSYLKERYGIDLVMGEDKNREQILGDPVTLEKYRTTLRILFQEISKYPPEMIHKMREGRVFEIRIVHTLYRKDIGNPDIPPKRVAGTALWPSEKGPTRVALDAGFDEFFQRKNIHHELNHKFAERNWQERDKKWVSFHAAVSVKPYHPESANVSSDVMAEERYFLTKYASSAPPEDQAVCAEWMMTPSLHVIFLDRWRNEKDPVTKDILAAKYIETKKNYSDWSDGKIGDAFWESIIAQGEKERGSK